MDNVCNFRLFSIPSKVEMAEERKNKNIYDVTHVCTCCLPWAPEVFFFRGEVAIVSGKAEILHDRGFAAHNRNFATKKNPLAARVLAAGLENQPSSRCTIL